MCYVRANHYHTLRILRNSFFSNTPTLDIHGSLPAFTRIMTLAVKIATCDYCQTRVVLGIQKGSRHSLVCTSCGAPLQRTELHLKELPVRDPQNDQESKDTRNRENRDRKDLKFDAERSGKSDDKYAKRKDKYRSKEKSQRSSSKYKKRTEYKSRRSKKKRGLRYWISEIIDEIEDFFD